MLSWCVLVKAHNATRLRFPVQVQKTFVNTATKDNTHSHCTAEEIAPGLDSQNIGEIANRDLTLTGTSDYQTAITHARWIRLLLTKRQMCISTLRVGCSNTQGTSAA